MYACMHVRICALSLNPGTLLESGPLALWRAHTADQSINQSIVHVQVSCPRA